MKQIIIPFIAVFVFVLAIAGCGDSGVGGNLLGQGGNVTFTMGTQTGGGGGTQFTWSPSTTVKVTKLILSTTGFSDTITDNSGTSYASGQTWAYPQEYTGVATGQQWQFVFTGTIDSANNAAFTSTANLTIP